MFGVRSLSQPSGAGGEDEAEHIEDWDNQGDGLGMHIVPEEVLERGTSRGVMKRLCYTR